MFRYQILFALTISLLLEDVFIHFANQKQYQIAKYRFLILSSLMIVQNSMEELIILNFDLNFQMLLLQITLQYMGMTLEALQ